MLVTFDFDSTLTTPVKESFPWDSETFWEADADVPNEKVLDILQAFVDEGHRVEIVTTRDRTNSKEVFDFIHEHSLPVRDVHFTGGGDKRETLLELGSDLHFDDSLHDLNLLEDTDVKTKIVPHPHDEETRPDEVNQFDKAI
jgi:hypothetical protein